MRAMIFAAGLGTRLKPWTEHHPKALVPVGGVPMLERVILRLKAAGITEMVVNVHHFADQIIDFLRERDNFGCDIHVSDERSLLLDTGGGILAARRWLEPGGQPFVVHNADILTDFDLTGMIDAATSSTRYQRVSSTITPSDIRGEDAPPSQSTPVATLLVAPRDTSRYLLFDDEMRMRGWTNIATGQVRPDTLEPDSLRMLAFGGLHILSHGIFESLSAYRAPGVPFSIIDYYIDNCATQLIRGYEAPTPYMWHDIGKPASLAAANAALAGGKQAIDHANKSI